MNSTSANIVAIQNSVPFFGLDMPHLQGNILLVEDKSFVLEVTAEISALGFSQGYI
jgi:hypothetical protein